MAGIPVAEGTTDGAQVTGPGQLQYGPMLLGGGTSAGWRQLDGWRDHPDSRVSDSPRPQGHGAYPGAVYGGALVVTFTYLLRGTPGDKLTDLATIERWTAMDGVDRMLAVNDGDGAWFRMARVIARSVPMDRNFLHAPLECSVQFLCADPRRYSLTAQAAEVALPTSTGGLAYPLTYPLGYGLSASGASAATNGGSMATPLTAVFRGPLTSPVLVAGGLRMGFDLTLADGDYLTVDTGAGTALLNGSADRLYTIRNDSDPLEACLLPPGTTGLTLSASAGTGRVDVSYRDARM